MDYNLTSKNWQYLQYSSYFSSKKKLLYISTPKVACTSLKWWFARLEGHAAAIRQLGGSLESSPELVIHDTFHKVAPDVTGLESAALTEIFNAPEILRFAVVRNPYKRLFSAWQSKLLLQEPLQSGPYLSSDFFHTKISTVESIAYAFECFLEHLSEQEAPTFWDPHWTPQVELLRPDLLPYTLIAKLENTTELEEILRSSLGDAFVNPFKTSNSNESLVPYSEQFFSTRSIELIQKLYHRDFEHFGYETSLPPSKAAMSDEAFKVALKGIEMIKSRHARIADFQQRIKTTEIQLQQQQRLAGERAQLIEKLLDANAALAQRAPNNGQNIGQDQTPGVESGHVSESLVESNSLRLLKERDAKIGKLTQDLAEHVQASEALYSTLNSRDQEILEIKAELNERTEQISELQRAIDEQSQKGEHFGKILSERNKELSRLRQHKAHAELSIEELKSNEANLKDLLHTQSAQIQELSRKITSYENLSKDSAQALECISQNEKSLRQDLLRHTELINELTDALEKHEQITHVYSRALALIISSRAWRIQTRFKKFMGPLQERISQLLIDAFEFNGKAYLDKYPDVAESGLSPEEHFLAFGLPEKRLYSLMTSVVHPEQPQTPLKQTAKTAAIVERVLQTARTIEIENKSEHSGNNSLPVHVDTFDAEIYLALYPDLKAAGVDPLEHYQLHGRAEGRIGNLPPLTIRGNTEEFDPRRKTILVVSHEASRTGAPILSLNIAQTLAQDHNVIAMLLGGGGLEEAFIQSNVVVVGPLEIRGNPILASLLMNKVIDQFDIDLALVNSIESRVVLPALAERFIPSMSLIHEFAAYTRPRQAFREALLWSGDTVFSADLTLQSAQSEYPELVKRHCHVLPQGRCIVPPESLQPETMAKERERIRKDLRPANQAPDTLIVLGAGFVQLRKGVDLFIECAARVHSMPGGEKCRFIWIGQGYDPDQDTGYSVYLADQIRRAGLENQLTFIAETSAIETVYEEADVLLLTSRLDPLPNVAIDAMDHGLPVICFDKTTGIADFLVSNGLEQECVAPYLDTAVMAEKVIALASSASHRREVGERCMLKSREYFDMPHYISRLEEMASDIQIQCRQEKADLITIEHSSLPRLDFILPPEQAGVERAKALRLYTRSWASGIGCRKPFPGFHPGVYLERNGLLGGGIDPLADFIRAGQPQGPWLLPVITPETSIEPIHATQRIALHIHAYYPDLLPKILERLSFNEVLPDLYISVPDNGTESKVSELLHNFEGHFIKVEVVPNKGRDIAPLLTVFGPELVTGYDIVGHIHTKKTADIADPMMGETWFNFLLDNLLGTHEHRMADTILGQMCKDHNLGMVFPDDPYITGWTANRSFAEELAPRLGLSAEALPEHFNFPVGTMFWARSAVLSPLVNAFGDLSEYPDEPLPYDGSMLHAMERLMPLVCTSIGSSIALTNTPGSSR
ncbi:rhamnan synthesis F family protein [Pseudomonas panipatensis]|uniref:Glycosyl transferases group 1 n=1 Tax=Pseudomonas panipatensis TaxID=428992 RepID=A0A1G8K1V5_9PSED|nr:rhamnan synthesis F family protein [Pseudomonas panipatensis]SDI37456.1 Glycosyl transferases group 1 [Pseudomonas panipatensis]SMP61187.1 Glycosyl transferases group 1 [Pseudomonas panipatensis]